MINIPYPQEHSCRLHPPNYPKYRRSSCAAKHDGKCIDFIYGIRGPKESELQSMRYDKKIWNAAAAKSHCQSKKGTFEAASRRSVMEIYLKSEGQYVKNEMTEDEYVNWFKSNIDDEGNVQEDCLLYKDAGLNINTDKSISWVMSDFTLDRDNEKMDPAGWDLKAFKKNPILQWAHDHRVPAIGRVESPRVKDNQLIGKVVFDEEDELAMKIKKKVENNFIRSGSVGFHPVKVEIPEDRNDPCRLIYRKQELLEFSICNVPANPNAMPVEEGKTDELEVEVKMSVDKEILEVIEEMKIDIENLKEMQMDMQGKIDKDNKNYYDAMLNRGKSKPKPKGLETLYPKKS